MSLSTSSSRKEWRIAALALGLLLACEVSLRLFEPSLSPYLRHLRELPQVSQELANAKGLRVLFLGNSMIHTDLNLEVFLEEINEGDTGPVKPISAAKVYIDDSHIAEWFYTFKHTFLDAGSVPDALVIGFADNQLDDDADTRPRRLARFHASLSDIPEMFANDLLTFPDRAEFLLSYISVSYALRDRVKRSLLSILVPYYEQSAMKLNDQLWQRALRAQKPDSTYHRLERLAALAGGRHVSLILVAMPKEDPYELPQQLFLKAQQLGITMIDARRVEGLGPRMFADELHMRPQGALNFSDALADYLAQPLRTLSQARYLTRFPSRAAVAEETKPRQAALGTNRPRP